jgi:TRAP-type uncharacterized transport system substrate-binding protein
MEPIIEIVSKNIYSNSRYNQKLKDEYVGTLNRITFTDKRIEQLSRTMEYILLFNVLHEEIKYITTQKKFFSKHIDVNVYDVLEDYFDKQIKKYNHYLSKL